MSEIAERYERLSQAFADKVAAVPDDQWSAQTPCEEWTARDVVRHVVDSQAMFLGFVGREQVEVPSVDEDPKGAVRAATGRILQDLKDPDLAAETFEGFLGTQSFEASVDRFLSADLAIHGWDLARATGLDETIDPRDMAKVRADAPSFGDAMRSPGAFGPELEAPEGASEQDKFLAFVGRRP